MSDPASERPRFLVEAGYGIGDVLVATPACHALWLLGFDVELFVNRPGAMQLAALFRGHDALRRVVADAREVAPAAYDFGLACHGPGEAVRRLPRPFGMSVLMGDVARHGLLNANLRVPRALGYDGDPPPATIRLSEEPAGLAPGTVVVHAGSDPAAPFKRWPHWEALCDRLRALGHPVTVVGTGDDRSARSWERRHDPRFDLPLEQLARVLRDARAYLGNDSGVSHLADAVGTPSLLLFGPTDPRLYAPRSATVHVIDAPAAPGRARHPFSKRYPSLEALAFDDVLAEVTRWLGDVRRGPAPVTPPRRGPPSGDASARCPTPREVASAPATLDAVDRLFQRAAAAAVLGALARRGDAIALAAWRRDAARAFGAVHVRAADAWRAIPTEFARRRERSHLRLAWRTSRSLRTFTRRMAVLVLPPRAVSAEADAPPR